MDKEEIPLAPGGRLGHEVMKAGELALPLHLQHLKEQAYTLTWVAEQSCPGSSIMGNPTLRA